VIILGEGDRGIDDRGAERPRLLHGFDRIGEHIGLVHDGLHRLVQCAAFGCEIVLILDENDRRRLGIHELLSRF
jgi:hypothetical protein